MDEATSSVDLDTDALIQKTIRKEFGQTTVLVIAHRIDTIIDTDKIMLLDKGELVDFDTPAALLRREDDPDAAYTSFRKMIDDECGSSAP
eukprot:COSAG02_NODE_53716_length_300_cov_0.741294_1_plen_89_part_10